MQHLRIKGTSLADEVYAERAVSGGLLTVLRRADDVIELVRQWPVPETALREATRYDIPAYAPRAFLMNAIMHQTYEANAPIRFYWFDAASRSRVRAGYSACRGLRTSLSRTTIEILSLRKR